MWTSRIWSRNQLVYGRDGADERRQSPKWSSHRLQSEASANSVSTMRQSVVFGTEFRRSPVLCRAGGFMTGSVLNERNTELPKDKSYQYLGKSALICFRCELRTWAPHVRQQHRAPDNRVHQSIWRRKADNHFWRRVWDRRNVIENILSSHRNSPRKSPLYFRGRLPWSPTTAMKLRLHFRANH